MKYLIIWLILPSLLLAENLTTTDGKTYTNYRVSKVEPHQITVVHTNGMVKIPFKKLPDDFKSKFKYDPTKADQFEKASIEADRQAQKELQTRREKAQKEKEFAQFLVEYQKSMSFISGSVVSVLNDGVIVNCHGSYGETKIGDNLHKTPGGLFYLQGDFRGTVDGSHVEYLAFPDGTYSYVNALGAVKTVAKYKAMMQVTTVQK